jgi:hypothetical protein
MVPPPTSAAVLIGWCGWRAGRIAIRLAWLWGLSEAAKIRVVSRAS